MILKIYSVFDSATCAYLQPMFCLSRGQALRSLTEAFNDKSHPFGKYPQDHVIFELGEFDDSTCKFTLHSAPVSLGVGIEFVNRVAESRVAEPRDGFSRDDAN